MIDYEAIREKAAIQKKDIERALTKYLAKTSETHNLFDSEEANIFPCMCNIREYKMHIRVYICFLLVIACKPTFPPYMNALLPQDQIFDPEDLEYDHKSQEEHQPPRKRLKSENKNENRFQTNDSEENNEAQVKQEETTPELGY